MPTGAISWDQPVSVNLIMEGGNFPTSHQTTLHQVKYDCSHIFFTMHICYAHLKTHTHIYIYICILYIQNLILFFHIHKLISSADFQNPQTHFLWQNIFNRVFEPILLYCFIRKIQERISHGKRIPLHFCNKAYKHRCGGKTDRQIL